MNSEERDQTQKRVAQWDSLNEQLNELQQTARELEDQPILLHGCVVHPMTRSARNAPNEYIAGRGVFVQKGLAEKIRLLIDEHLKCKIGMLQDEMEKL